MDTSRLIVEGLCVVFQRLPRMRGLGRLQFAIANHFRQHWNQGRVWLEIDGLQMNLDPREAVDNALIFTPKWVDSDELKAARSILRPGDVFLDVGANVGWYSMLASSIVGESGQVVAIEANPQVANVIRAQVLANGFENVLVHNLGVAPNESRLRLWLNTSGNLGRSTLADKGTDRDFESYVEVDCRPLSSFVTGPVRMMKMDIEGLEFDVLNEFLPSTDWLPDFVLIEQWDSNTDDSVVDLLTEHGYSLIDRWGSNYLLASPTADDIRLARI